MSQTVSNNFLYSKLLGIGSAVILSYYFRRKLNKTILNIDEGNQVTDGTVKEVNKVLFFTLSGLSCREYLKSFKSHNCGKQACSLLFLRKIINYIESAKVTLDICIFLLTSEELFDAIVKVAKRGVHVRIIKDEEMSKSTGSKINMLRKKGIEVRCRQSTFVMHHKYAVIDKKIVMSGSLNWTVQAIYGNEENVVITSQKELVKCYLNNFEKLWNKFICI